MGRVTSRFRYRVSSLMRGLHGRQPLFTRFFRVAALWQWGRWIFVVYFNFGKTTRIGPSNTQALKETL